MLFLNLSQPIQTREEKILITAFEPIDGTLLGDMLNALQLISEKVYVEIEAEKGTNFPQSLCLRLSLALPCFFPEP